MVDTKPRLVVALAKRLQTALRIGRRRPTPLQATDFRCGHPDLALVLMLELAQLSP